MPEPSDHVDPFTLPTVDERIALATSILGHAPDCEHCEPLFDRLKLALQGATISEVARLAALTEGVD